MPEVPEPAAAAPSTEAEAPVDRELAARLARVLERYADVPERPGVWRYDYTPMYDFGDPIVYIGRVVEEDVDEVIARYGEWARSRFTRQVSAATQAALDRLDRAYWPDLARMLRKNAYLHFALAEGAYPTEADRKEAELKKGGLLAQVHSLH